MGEAGRWEYDVFLSFRGEDTRKNFTDHLYAALKRENIYTFRDDEKLERGKEIAPSLLNAIQHSRFSVIVLSINYADSSWCLDELVHILECRQSLGVQVFPVFYKVDISEVEQQSGSIGKEFEKHDKRFQDDQGTKRVLKWRSAFKQVANHPIKFVSQGNDANVVKEIVDDIKRSLRKVSQNAHKDYLVAMDVRVQEMKSLFLDFAAQDVHFIGICGVQGIGKSRVARAVFDEISDEFEAKSFLANIKGRDLVSLQKQLLSETLGTTNVAIWDTDAGIRMIQSRLRRKKIALVLDNVDDVEQLESLAGNKDWFGAGSIIIVTSRDENLLKRHEIDIIHEPRKLNEDESLTLFCMKAFHLDHPPEDYASLSKSFVDYADGLPSALEVMGSFLFNRSIPEWNSTFRRLRGSPDGWKSLKNK